MDKLKFTFAILEARVNLLILIGVVNSMYKS